MTKIVDWDARRDEILETTWRVIARDGLAKTTVRAIAHEARLISEAYSMVSKSQYV